MENTWTQSRSRGPKGLSVRPWSTVDWISYTFAGSNHDPRTLIQWMRIDEPEASAGDGGVAGAHGSRVAGAQWRSS
jgi:hypothetical protein